MRANLAPFLIFLAFLLVRDGVAKLGAGSAHWALASPQYWVFPLQTFVCGVLLWVYRREYDFRPSSNFGSAAAVNLADTKERCVPAVIKERWLPAVVRFGFAVAVGIAAFGIWIAPQLVFQMPPRLDGFDPAFFGSDGWPYWMNLILRLARMVVVVPLVEEIFWRGFLLRYLVKDDFRSVPFGTFTWTSFLITTFAFCLEHRPADWPAAIITGALYNLTAYRTRSLAACVVAHAVTNMALGFYILHTRQWGFW